MGRIFQPAIIPTNSSPEVDGMIYTPGQTFLKGAVLIYNAGNVTEGGADPTGIVGIALADAASGPGLSLSFDSKVNARTGTFLGVSVAKANRMTVFSGRMVNGGTDPVTPVAADIGTAYGLLKTGANEWVVDQAEVVNTRLRITKIDIGNKIVYFRFLEANLGQP